MVERLFHLPKINRIRRCWLAEPIERYIEWLVQRRYARDSIVDRIPVLIHFGEFAHSNGTSRVEDLPAKVDEFVDFWVHGKQRRGPRAYRASAQKTRGTIEQMLRLSVPGFHGGRWPALEWPFRDQAPGFLTYLKDERGLSPNTIHLYEYHLRSLEMHMTKVGITALGDLSPSKLSTFMIKRSHDLGRSSLAGCAGVLRAFLRYSRREGLIAADLAGSVDRPRSYRLATIPRSISWQEAARLLQAVDRTRVVGKRDYAMLLLLLSYGLRAREVAALSLDDLDWRRERLRVPNRKGGRSSAYPLLAPVGEALIDYLRNARPLSVDRHVFLQVKAPFTPLGFVDVGNRTSRRLRMAGIQAPRMGSHTLRHTCVQRLVDAGFGLKDIGDFVGHRLPETTQIYAKVAIAALREVGLARGEGAL